MIKSANPSPPITKKTFRSFIAYKPQYAGTELKALVLNPDASLDAENVQILKKGDASTVWITSVDGRKLVVKRYNVKNIWHGIKKILRRSNAETSWRGAATLLSCSINTPAPVALVEKRIGLLRMQTYFISEYVEGISCCQFFLHPSLHTSSLTTMAKKLLNLFKQLEKHKIAHGDMKGTNVLIAGDKPFLTDLDYMQQYRIKSFFNYRHLRDKQRFMRVWQNEPKIAKMFSSLINQ